MPDRIVAGVRKLHVSSVSVLPQSALRSWSIKSVLAIADQGIVSGSNFLLNILLARWLSAEAYGAFAVTFTCFLLASGLHNVLVLEPMSVMGPRSYHSSLPAYFKGQVRIHFKLTAILMLLMWVGALFSQISKQAQLVVSLFGMGAVLPLMLLFWLARRMLYIQQNPQIAAIASGAYGFVIILGLFFGRYSHHLGLLSIFIVIGCSSLVASSFLLFSAGVFSPTAHVPDRDILQENWKYGSWLLGSTLLYSASFQIQTFIVAGQLGMAAAGTLRALQLPSLAMTQATTAISTLGLSSLSYDAGRGDTHCVRKKGNFITLLLTGSAVIYEFVLIVAAKPLESVLYQGKFASDFWLIPALGLVPVLFAFSTGLSLSLRALKKTKFDLLSNALSAPIGLCSALIFIRIWGIGGAVASSILAGTASAIVVLFLYRAWGPMETRATVAN